MMHNEDKKPKKLKHAKNIRGQGMRTLNEHQAEGWDESQMIDPIEDLADRLYANGEIGAGETDPEILSEYLSSNKERL